MKKPNAIERTKIANEHKKIHNFTLNVTPIMQTKPKKTLKLLKSPKKQPKSLSLLEMQVLILNLLYSLYYCSLMLTSTGR